MTRGTASTPATTTRKRLRTALVTLVCVVACHQDGVMGFVQHSISTSPRTLTTPVLQAVSKPASSSAKKGARSSFATQPQSLPRLTDKEQQELLQQAVEFRRIQQVEKELVVQSSKSSTPLVSLRCEKAGYGDDIDAFETALSLGQQARETLVTRNMGLVHYCIQEILCKRSKMKSLSREDLVQEGAIGLARAVDRWDPEIGGKFSTYAVYWIRAAVLRCIAERDDLMRVPEHVTNTARKVSKAAKRLGLEIDGENIVSTLYSNDASWKEAQAAKALAIEAGLTDKQLKQVMKVQTRRSRGMLSYEAWMQDGKNYETDLVEQDNEESSMSSLETEQLRNTLSRFLRPREMEALSWRYGLVREPEPQEKAIPVKGKWGEAMSFVEVGKKMEVSAEYGRRLCKAALDKLRRAADEGALEPALLSYI